MLGKLFLSLSAAVGTPIAMSWGVAEVCVALLAGLGPAWTTTAESIVVYTHAAAILLTLTLYWAVRQHLRELEDGHVRRFSRALLKLTSLLADDRKEAVTDIRREPYDRMWIGARVAAVIAMFVFFEAVLVAHLAAVVLRLSF